MDLGGGWVLVPFSLHHFLVSGWEEDREEQEMEGRSSYTQSSDVEAKDFILKNKKQSSF